MNETILSQQDSGQPLYTSDVKNQLDIIETQTKQTNIDLEQLFERLKSNNKYLNKVLEDIANYSKQVTKKGNATKDDMIKVLDQISRIENSTKNILEESKDEVISTLLNYIRETEENNLQQRREFVKSIGDTRLLSLQNSKILETLEHVLQNTESTQSKEALKDGQTPLASGDATKETDLESKYKILCLQYDEKLKNFHALEEKFCMLLENFKSLKSEVSQLNVDRYGKLQQLHNDKLGSLQNHPTTFNSKRISSVPTKAHIHK